MSNISSIADIFTNKNLSNILQYFQVPVVSGCPYSLKLTMANVVKAFPAL